MTRSSIREYTEAVIYDWTEMGRSQLRDRGQVAGKEVATPGGIRTPVCNT